MKKLFLVGLFLIAFALQVQAQQSEWVILKNGISWNGIRLIAGERIPSTMHLLKKYGYEDLTDILQSINPTKITFECQFGPLNVRKMAKDRNIYRDKNYQVLMSPDSTVFITYRVQDEGILSELIFEKVFDDSIRAEIYAREKSKLLTTSYPYVLTECKNIDRQAGIRFIYQRRKFYLNALKNLGE